MTTCIEMCMGDLDQTTVERNCHDENGLVPDRHPPRFAVRPE